MRNLIIIWLMAFSYYSGIAQHIFFIEDKEARKETQTDLLRNIIKDFWQKELAGIAEDSRDHYEQIEMLQKEIREALKLAETIKDLQWSDFTVLLEYADDVSFDFNAYINPGLDYVEQFKNIYDHREDLHENAQAIYRLLMGFDLKNAGPTDYEELLKQQKEAAAIAFAFFEMADKKKMQTAKAYKVMAEEMQEKAAELNQAVLLDDKFSMTEAERITLLKFSEDYLVQSFELIEKSDQLIESVINSPYSIRNQAIQIYSNNIYQQSVKVDGQYRFGE